MHALVAELAVAQAGNGVVFVEALLRLGGGLDVPFDQRGPHRLGDFVGQNGLAGAGFAFDQQRTPQQHGGVDGHLEIIGGDIVAGALKTHAFHPVFFNRLVKG